MGAAALPKSTKKINTFLGTELLSVKSSCLTHVHIDTMITVFVSCPNANKVMTLLSCTTCSLFMYVLPRTLHSLVSMLRTVQFHVGYCLVLSCTHLIYLHATGDQWPHSFGSVRLPVTGSGRWQPNQSFPSGREIGIHNPQPITAFCGGLYFTPHQNPQKRGARISGLVMHTQVVSTDMHI